jgi:colanic acid biosynthesis glycosyl transferase WcaI
MRIQLWSYNYDPEPAGIGPISTVWAHAMRARGHEIEVVAAHPHYPSPVWGNRIRPYREVRDGIPVLRLPLWIGRASAAERMRQELSFVASQTLAIGALRTPDVIVVVSPSFPALAPAMLNSRIRGVPWVLWLQDILPEGAASTGIVESGAILRASLKLEATAYRRAAQIVVISDSFEENLRGKGVPEHKITRIYNPSTRQSAHPVATADVAEPRILNLGNIGHSQGLVDVVRAFERNEELARRRARLVFAGAGVAEDEVRAAITTDRVDMLGLLFGDDLERELQRATVGIVSQRADLTEFNVPSKLMNLLAYGIPVVASVRRPSEVERIVLDAGGGWITESARPDEYTDAVATALGDSDERRARGTAGFDFARRNLTPDGLAERFERVLEDAVGQSTASAAA